MNFQENITLENDFILLRALQEEDFDHLRQFVIVEPEIWLYSLVQISTPEHLKNYIDQAIGQRKQGKEYPFVVYDKKSNQYAGCTRYYDIQLENKTLQLGYTWYGKKFQGTHVNKNCKLLLLEYAFENLEMERVEFRADNRNERSKHAMLSIGCVAEGVLRNHLPTSGGGRRDSIILSILKDEWQQGLKSRLIQKLSKLPAS